MSKSILFSHGGVKGFFVAFCTTNGVGDIEAMVANSRELATKATTEISTDFDSVSAECNSYLRSAPGLKSVALKSLARAIWETRIEAGTVKAAVESLPITERAAAKDSMFERLTEVLENYVKSNPDTFYIGKGHGVCIRKVDGEVQVDTDGQTVYNAAGDEIPAVRYTDQEWSELTAKRDAAKAAALAAAPSPAA